MRRGWLSARLVAGVVFLAALPHVRADLPASNAYVFQGAQVILEPGKVLDNAVVVVRGGVIEAVGIDVPVPFDALRIDATGMVLHAGLIDGGSGEGYDPGQRRSEAGPPPPVDVADTSYASMPPGNYRLLTPEFRVSEAARWDEKELEAWRLRGFTDRLVTPMGGILAGQSALFSLSGRPNRESLLADRVAQHLVFETSGREYPTTLMGMIAHVRQAFHDAEHLSQWRARFGERGKRGRPPPIDPTLDALAPILAREQRLAIAAETEEEIHRALALADELDVRPVVVGGREAWKLAAILKAKEIPVLLSLKLPPEPKLADAPGDGPDGSAETKHDARSPDNPIDVETPARARREIHRRWRRDLAGIKKLDEAGIAVGFRMAGLKPDEFSKSLETLSKRGGLSDETLLRLLTTGPARVLGVEDRLGAVAPGKLARLVVRKGMPHEKDSWVRQVLIDGRLYDYPLVDGKPPGAKEKAKLAFGAALARTEGPSEPSDAGTPRAEKGDEAEPPADPEPLAATTLAEGAEPEPACEIEADRRPSRRSGGNLLLRGATLLTAGPAGDLEGADIAIADGKIVAVGPRLRADPGTLTLDARGLVVMPGIIDSHSHMAISGGVNESSLSVTPEVRVRDVVNSRDVTIFRALAGGVTMARLLHGSANTIGGQDAVIKLKYGQPAAALVLEDAPAGVKFALGENVTRTRGRFPSSRLGVEAVLTRAFAEADDYRRARTARLEEAKAGVPTDPLRRDDRLEALARVLEGDLKIHCHCYRADEILMLLRVADRFGIKVQSLQHALEGYKVAPEIARHGASVSTFSDWWAYKWEAYDATPYNTALLRAAGVDVCLKSDSNELVRHMNQEAAKLLRYGGFTADQALETITLIPARLLGLAERVGSIEVGKDADLAVFHGHPLNTYARCVLTVIDGEIEFEDRGYWRTIGEDSRNERAAHEARELRPPGPALARADGPTPRLRVPLNESGTYAITGATVYPVDGSPIEKGAVIVAEGKIAAVGPDATIDIPAEATRVDGRGLCVYPGLIDAGTKVGLAEVDSAQETIDFMEEGEFQPDLRAASAVHPDSELIAVTRAGGVTTVVAMPTSGILSGQSALVNLAGWVPAEMVLVDPLALHVRLPSAPRFLEKAPKPFTGRGRLASERSRRLGELKSLFQLARHYHAAKDEALRRRLPPPVLQPRLEALGPYTRREKPVIFRADTTRDMKAALELASELGVRPILSGCRDAWKIAGELKAKDVPVIVGPILTECGASYDPYDAPFSNLAKLHAAGVRFCVQSDDTSNARNLPFHAAMAVAYGLPPEEGLRAITLYSARILGVENQLGSVTPGKVANLVLTDGDPLQAATNIVHLFLAGQPIEPTSKHTRLYERYARRLEEYRARPAGAPVEPAQEPAEPSPAAGQR